MARERYKYEEYAQDQAVSLADLKQLKTVVLYSGKSKVDSFIAGAKALVVVGIVIAYHFAKKDLMEIDKQKYEEDRSNQNRDDLDRDPLDSEKRKPDVT